MEGDQYKVEMGPTMNSKKVFAGCTKFIDTDGQEKIIVAAGGNKDVYLLDIRSNTWKTLPVGPTGAIGVALVPNPERGSSIGAYLFNEETMYAFSKQTREWRKVTDNLSSRKMGCAIVLPDFYFDLCRT